MALENDMNPSPVCPEAFKEVNWGGDVCALLRNLLMTNEKVGMLTGWMMNPTPTGVDPSPTTGESCTLTAQFAAQLIGLANPIGSGFWSAIDLDLDEKEWVEAKGQSLLKEGNYANLYLVIGDQFNPTGWTDTTRFHLPKLQGRFLLNRGQRDPFVDNEGVTHTYPNYDFNDRYAGEDTVMLLPTNVPSVDHKHGMGVINGYPTVTNGDQFYIGLPRPPQPDYSVRNHSVKKAISTGNALEPDDPDSFVDTDKTHFITTEPIAALRSNTPVEDEELVAHNNMPPHVVGIYYIRANYIINGQIIKLKAG